MAINPEYRSVFLNAADKFMKKNKDCKCTREKMMEFFEFLQEEHLNEQVYFEKYPTKTGKDDLTILVPRPMKHLFRGWKVRVMRLKENDQMKE